MPMNGFVAAGPSSSIPDTRQDPRVSVTISDRQQIAAIGTARIHPRGQSDFLLESPSIRGTMTIATGSERCGIRASSRPTNS